MVNNAGFRYQDVLNRGRPRHDPLDPFSIRHPPMPLSRRAKIFAPFDALKGYNEAINAKTIEYECKHDLSNEKKWELDQKISVLRKLTYNQRIALENQVTIQVEYYVPCPDPNHEAYGRLGSYENLTGVCMGVDVIKKVVKLDDKEISADDIADIEILR